jgi:hypothetical protein
MLGGRRRAIATVTGMAELLLAEDDATIGGSLRDSLSADGRHGTVTVRATLPGGPPRAVAGSPGSE